MNLEVHIRVNEQSYAWRTGDAPEHLDVAIAFLQEQRNALSTSISLSKPIVTDDPEFVLTKPK